MTVRTWDKEVARERIEALRDVPGATLPMLNALQEEFGYVDEEAIPIIADVLNLSRAEIVGVVHFYHDYRHAPPGRHIFKVCHAEACQSMGCEALVEYLEQRLGVAVGETTLDGSITLDAVYCLGNCALSPAVMIDGNLHGRVTPERANTLIAETRRQG